MKAMSKSELADAAGVSLETLRKWCAPYQQQFDAMGLKRSARVLPPRAVKFLAEKYCIDLDE